MMNTVKINREAFWVFLGASFLCFANIWGYPITILDEAKNAEAAREMLLNHNLIPYFNEVLRTDKPLLHYIFMQFGYSIFGINEFGARFFGALFGVGFITYFYLFLNKFTSRNIARMGTFVLMSSFFWIQEFHLAVPDPYFIVLLCLSWLFFYNYYHDQKHLNASNFSQKFLWLFYIFVGLATLAKGPLAIGLTGLIVLCFLLFKKELNGKIFSKYQVILGGLLILIIAAPWFIWIHYRTDGAFTQGFFYHHNLKRFQEVNSGHGGIFLVTWAFVILGIFPFGAFVPQSLWHAWKFRKRNDLVNFSLIIALVVIIFFSISSTKLPNYTLPAIPFLAILIAYYFEEIFQFGTLKNIWSYISTGLISLVSMAIPVAIFILFQHDLVQELQIIFTLIAALVVLIGLFFVWKSLIKNQLQYLIMSIGSLWMVLGVIIFYMIYPNLSRIEPVIQSYSVIENNNVVVFDNYDPAFNFNYQSTYMTFNNTTELMSYLKDNPSSLVLTKDRSIKDNPDFAEGFKVLFNEPSVFENYRTLILKKVE